MDVFLGRKRNVWVEIFIVNGDRRSDGYFKILSDFCFETLWIRTTLERTYSNGLRDKYPLGCTELRIALNLMDCIV